MMDEQKRGKKRPKSYYIKCAAGGKKANRSTCIEPGMKGFLVTCNKYERETVREMYNILNEYADKLYGPENPESSNHSTANSDGSSDEEEDIEKAMAKETAAIKQASSQQRRFQNTNTKTKNVIFIRTTIDDPCDLAHSIFEDMYQSHVQKARYAQRIIPVSNICKVDSKTITTAMNTVLAKHFETDFGVGIKYTAICKIRNNNTISRNVLLPILNRIIQEMNPLHQLCHDEPDLVIVIEVMRAVCCISVVKDFFKFRKYNFHEIVKSTENDVSAVVDKEPENVEPTEVNKAENTKTTGLIEGKTGEVANVGITEDKVKAADEGVVDIQTEVGHVDDIQTEVGRVDVGGAVIAETEDTNNTSSVNNGVDKVESDITETTESVAETENKENPVEQLNNDSDIVDSNTVLATNA